MAAPVTIPSDGSIKVIPPYTGADLAVGTSLTVSGWGATATTDWSTTLMTVNVKVQPMSQCQISGTTQVCAFDTTKDSCKGDSGGPLAVSINGVNQLYGLTSFGGAEQCTGSYGVYSKVSAYNSWIVSTMNGGNPSNPPPLPGSTNGLVISFIVICVSTVISMF